MEYHQVDKQNTRLLYECTAERFFLFSTRHDIIKSPATFRKWKRAHSFIPRTTRIRFGKKKRNLMNELRNKQKTSNAIFPHTAKKKQGSKGNFLKKNCKQFASNAKQSKPGYGRRTKAENVPSAPWIFFLLHRKNQLKENIRPSSDHNKHPP